MIRRNKLFDVLRFVVADFASVKKKFIEQGEEEAEVEKYLKMFKELRDSQKIREIEDKNIDNWGKKPFTQLVEFVESLVDLPTEIRQLKQKNIKGAKLVAENDEWYVYEISQYEASRHLADGAGWCIKHENHWLDYTIKKRTNSDFYFLISKTRSNERTTRDPPLYVDKWKKIALQIDETGSITYWDVPDTSHTSLPAEVSNIPEFTPVFSGRITIDGKKSRLDSIKEIPEGSTIDKIDAGVLKKLKEIPEYIKVGIIDLNGTDIEKIPPIACQKLYLNFPECKVKEIPEDVDITELYLDKSPDIILPKGLTVDIISLVNSKVSKLPEHMKVKGILDLSSSVIDEIPIGLKVNSLYLNKLIKKIPSGTEIYKNLDLSLAEDVELPDNLHLDSIKGVSNLSKLPNGFYVRNDDLDLSESKIKELPENLTVLSGELKIPKGITHLPPWLRAEKLDLQNSDVVSIEWNTKVNQLNINNTKIKELPLHKSYLYLSLRNTPVEEIPEEIKSVGFLDIRGTKIEKIPDSLKNVSTMYINDKISSLPETLSVEKRVYAKEGQLQVIPEHLASKVMEIY